MRPAGTVIELVRFIDTKVQGPWNLYNAIVTARILLDFRVLFTSRSRLTDKTVQGHYTGANTFLDAFV